jgi:hypothetical protein
VYDRLAQYSGHVPVTAEFEFEYKKLRKERERLTTSRFCIGQTFQNNMEEHNLLEEYGRIGLRVGKCKINR